MFNLEIINEGHQTSIDLDLHQVVSKPIEKLQYSKYIDDRSIALDYFESTEINSEDHLELNDHSWKVVQNNPNFFRENKEGETESLVINSIYRELLITNTVLKSDKDGFEKPLWHRHKRRDIKEVDIHYISNGESIDVNEGFVLKGGCVYTNYKNSFDYKTSNYRVYFVSGVTISGVAFNELLNVIPAIGPTLYRILIWIRVRLSTTPILFNRMDPITHISSTGIMRLARTLILQKNSIIKQRKTI